MAGTKSFCAQPGELDKTWWLIDGDDALVGRLASEIAMILMGKHQPTYTPHLDTGDYVIVVNVDKIRFSGNKAEIKTYLWYTGYAGGLRSETAAARLQRAPEQVLRDAVRRMLPKNKLGVKMLDKLKMYRGNEHPHQAQNPQPRQLKANARG